jgi:phosphoglycerate kinase
VSSKITVIENILDKVDHMIIVTFRVKNWGMKMTTGFSLEILRLAKEKGVQIHIPVDVVAANLF